MRTLFYSSDKTYTGCARTFVEAAAGLAARGHQVTLACCPGSAVERRAAERGVETVAIQPDANVASDAWWLRKLMQERFIEVALCHAEREQLVVSSAMRLAERGSVLRRVEPFRKAVVGTQAKLAAKMTATGLLFTTQSDAAQGEAIGLPIPPAVAPLGLDPERYAGLEPVSRTAVGLPATGPLIVCHYDKGGRMRLATMLRTLALLAPRHPKIHVAVVGPGSREDDLRMHASALGVGPIVTFLGEREDHHAILRAADVGWVISEGDEGAWALLDFMAMRIPVLCERGPLAQHYAADLITGISLAPGDAAHTASSIAAFLANAEGRAAMGNAGMVRVQREFTVQAMIDGFERAATEAGDRSRWASAR